MNDQPITTNAWKVLLVDDEPSSRQALTAILEKLLPQAVLTDAADAPAALIIAAQQPTDVAFVDIEMPGQNGIELAGLLLNLAKPPLIIFATASSEHAVQAFDLNAVDYVIKPFTSARISEAIGRAEKLLTSEALRSQQTQSIRDLLADSNNTLNKLWAERSNGGRVLIDFSEIGWASARDKEVFIRTAREELRVRMSLGELETSLPPDTFVRVHRSHLININLAREVIPWDSHSMTLIMGDKEKTEIPVSRKYVQQLKTITGW